VSASVPGANGARPRSIALIGPYGSGKSALYEALLTTAGAPIKRGDPRARRMGTELRLGHCSYLGDAWSILDCPGSVEFAYEAASALAVVDLAVVVCEPSPQRAVTVEPLLKALDDARMPHIVFVNKIDTLEGRVRDTLSALQGHSRAPLVLRQVPIREGEAVTGYVDVVSERAYRYRRGQASELVQLPAEVQASEREARDALLEVLADHDDALMEKILEDVTPSTEEIYAQLRKDLAEDAAVAVLLGAAEHDHGVRRLWKALRHDTPAAAHTAARRGIAPEGEVLVQVFKTVHAGHGGKLSYSRVWRGSVKDGMTLNGVRLGGITVMPSGEPAKVPQAREGELVALGRLEGIATGTTLSASGNAPALPFPPAPAPVYSFAVATGDRNDDVKLSGALQRLVDEDPALRVEQDAELAQTVLHGQGEMHLNNAIERLAKAYNLKVNTAAPRVGFKETIRQAVHQHARLKRQTGGHGQFADVKLDIAPRGRGEGFIFYDKIVGGSVPRQYIPAVGEAAEDAARKGPLGYPVVDISVTLVDGTFHSVDSSDMAFKTATRMAMQEGLGRADPVLLEPIDHVTISVPNEYTPRAQRLLTGRRGQILGYTEAPDHPGWDDVEALVPAAELHDLIIELRSQTLGLGTYRRRFDHLTEARGRMEKGAA
jgi:elongation factor G